MSSLVSAQTADQKSGKFIGYKISNEYGQDASTYGIFAENYYLKVKNGASKGSIAFCLENSAPVPGDPTEGYPPVEYSYDGDMFKNPEVTRKVKRIMWAGFPHNQKNIKGSAADVDFRAATQGAIWTFTDNLTPNNGDKLDLVKNNEVRPLYDKLVEFANSNEPTPEITLHVFKTQDTHYRSGKKFQTLATIDFPVETPPAPSGEGASLATTVGVGAKTASTGAALELVSGATVRTDVVDTVRYTGLVKGAAYTLTGELMDVTDAASARQVAAATVKFTATEANGTQTVMFNNVNLEPGRKYVVFEEAVSDNAVIDPRQDGNKTKHTVTHKNADDKAQTVVVNRPGPSGEGASLATTVGVGNKTASDAAALELVSGATMPTNVVDTVRYTGLVKGAAYTLTGELMDVTDAASARKVAAATVKFTAPEANGTQTVMFNNVNLEPGRKYVVFEEAVSDNAVIDPRQDGNKTKQTVTHKDPQDKAQTVVVNRPGPSGEGASLATTVGVGAKTASTGAALELVSGATVRTDVVDTVRYTGLVKGAAYTLTGELMDVTDAAAARKVAAATVKFTAPEANGTQTVTFNNVDLEPGRKYVVFEEAVSDNAVIDPRQDGNKTKQTVTHKDPQDKAQTVVVNRPGPSGEGAKLSTTVLVDGQAGTAETPATLISDKQKTLDVVDTVIYEGLILGSPYVLTGKLMDVTDTTAQPKEIMTASMNFTPTKAKDFTTVTFKGVQLEPGHKYVVFEEAVSEDTIIDQAQNGFYTVHRISHADATDKAQTVVVVKPGPSGVGAKLATTVTADGKSGAADAPAVLVTETSVTKPVTDTVNYEGLIVDATYVLSGRLMDITNGADEAKAVEIATAKKEFTPNAANGVETIDFSAVELMPGHTYVVFEEAVSKEAVVDLKQNGVLTIHKVTHADANDKAQTIVVVKPGPSGQGAALATTVGVDGKSASKIAELKVVSPNTVIRTVIDTVTYTGLIKDEEYILTGRLMDVTNGTDVATAIEVAKATTIFPAETEDGMIEVTFENVPLEPGKKYVVFEEAVSVEKIVDLDQDGNRTEHTITHEDPTDKAQTVVVVKPGPEGKDALLATTVSVDGKPASAAAPLQIVSGTSITTDVVDTVDYQGLIAGASYVLTGRLMDVTDLANNAKPAEIAQAKIEFVAEQDQGSTTVTFKDVKLEPGRKYVVFENAISKDLVIDPKQDGVMTNHEVSHENPDDKAQTVVVTKPGPEGKDALLATTVSVDGKPASVAAPLQIVSGTSITTDVVDTVDYQGLVAGASYVLTGRLMDVTDNAANPTEIAQATAEFVADKDKGSTTVTFTSVKLEPGRKYVVFENAISKDEVIDPKQDGVLTKHEVSHENPNDKAQTVVVKKPAPETPGTTTPNIPTPGIPSTTTPRIPSPENPNTSAPRTPAPTPAPQANEAKKGLANTGADVGGLFLLGLGLIGGGFALRRRGNATK
ncbi:VaFE repeat-containing surface-anchored protein [Corynebacterium caspium]|uniref:VaFE repeat-containing surface-anchored protein n=3 Tax=Corynebacterium caspium TaxID=234828 RepID=UPI002648127F|nr:VaFE repeat-containing surface-anchored protein [Corynebacterium caspium]